MDMSGKSGTGDGRVDRRTSDWAGCAPAATPKNVSVAFPTQSDACTTTNNRVGLKHERTRGHGSDCRERNHGSIDHQVGASIENRTVFRTIMGECVAAGGVHDSKKTSH